MKNSIKKTSKKENIESELKSNASGSVTIKFRKLALELGFFDKPIYTLPEETAFETSLQQFIRLNKKT